mmetsp:Transcript_12770/g.28260  ORF Transcript_12770/g.28260 Transcript_12770/m.28260 type:complete len:703 (-) Transcript_12770:493-2601(-)
MVILAAVSDRPESARLLSAADGEGVIFDLEAGDEEFHEQPSPMLLSSQKKTLIRASVVGLFLVAGSFSLIHWSSSTTSDSRVRPSFSSIVHRAPAALRDRTLGLFEPQTDDANTTIISDSDSDSDIKKPEHVGDEESEKPEASTTKATTPPPATTAPTTTPIPTTTADLSGTCASMQCPTGYSMRPEPATLQCTHGELGKSCAQDDLFICCVPTDEACRDGNTLDFGPAKLIHNNLDGQGPFSKTTKPGITLQNVFSVARDNANPQIRNLEIFATSRYEKPSEVEAENGLNANHRMVQLSVRRNTSVDLSFRFVEDETSRPYEADSQWIAFYNLNGVKLTISGFLKYELPDTTKIHPELEESGSVTFTAPAYDDDDKLNVPLDPLYLSKEHRQHMVTVLLPKTTSFSVTYSVFDGPHNGLLLMSGPSAVNCLPANNKMLERLAILEATTTMTETATSTTTTTTIPTTTTFPAFVFKPTTTTVTTTKEQSTANNDDPIDWSKPEYAKQIEFKKLQDWLDWQTERQRQEAYAHALQNPLGFERTTTTTYSKTLHPPTHEATTTLDQGMDLLPPDFHIFAPKTTTNTTKKASSLTTTTTITTVEPFPTSTSGTSADAPTSGNATHSDEAIETNTTVAASSNSSLKSSNSTADDLEVASNTTSTTVATTSTPAKVEVEDTRDLYLPQENQMRMFNEGAVDVYRWIP